MRVLLVLWVTVMAGCYAPTIAEGLPCGDGMSCPSGQHCAAGTCTRSTPDDGSIGDDDAIADASPFDAATIDAPPHATGWFDATPLPAVRSLACAVAFDNRLYLVGGSLSGASRAEVYVAPILGDGMLGTWASAAPLPNPTRWHACAVHAATRSIYVVGGDLGTTASTTVRRAAVANDGTLTWSSQPALPAGRRGLGVVIEGSAMFALGGEEADGFTLRNTVYVSAIDGAGALGAWTTTTTLPGNDYEFGTASAGGRVYLTGGYHGNANSYEAPVAGNALGAFTAVTSLPGTRERHVSVAMGGYVYIAGGEPTYGAANLATAARASILASGSLGAWAALPDMPLPIAYSTAATDGSRMYVVGGSDNLGQVASVLVYYP